MQREHIHFVTGRLAEHALSRLLAELGPEVGFDYSIDVSKLLSGATSRLRPKQMTLAELEEVVVLKATHASGAKADLRLWIVDRDDGAWVSTNGNQYATAMACIVLQVPNNYLPILQR